MRSSCSENNYNLVGKTKKRWKNRVIYSCDAFFFQPLEMKVSESQISQFFALPVLEAWIFESDAETSKAPAFPSESGGPARCEAANLEIGPTPPPGSGAYATGRSTAPGAKPMQRRRQSLLLSLYLGFLGALNIYPAARSLFRRLRAFWCGAAAADDGEAQTGLHFNLGTEKSL